MLKRVIETISRYSMFEPGQRVGVAVSGGADSVCLLHVLRELAPAWALKLTLLHLDHGLRGEESSRDADFVRSMAGEMALPVRVQKIDVGRILAEGGGNLEQVARQVRLAFLLGFLRAGEADRVALGHTRSDQAETVLFRLLRGAGTTGLAAMAPVTVEGFVRPLIEVKRTEVEEFLRERGIAWREDSTNLDLSFARNRIRHELLPALARDWNPAMVETLSRIAAIAREDEQYWEEEIGRLEAEHLVRQAGGVLLRADVLTRLPLAAGRRLVRRALEMVKGDLRQVDFAHTEQILGLARCLEGHGRVQVSGVDVMRSFDWVRFAFLAAAEPQARNYRVALAVPGEVPVPGADGRLRLELIENTEEGAGKAAGSGYNEGGSELDWHRLRGPLELRNWRPGDQYRPVGHAAIERVKSLFQRARVPLWERRNWPVITSGGTILWTRRFGPAADFASTAQSRVVLRVTEVADFVGRGNLTEGFQRL